MSKNHLLSFLLLFASIFCVSTAQSAVLQNITIDCSYQGGRNRPLSISGEVGDTFTITPIGQCGFYTNVGGNVVSSNPPFNDILWTTATVSLTAAGNAYIEVWNNNLFQSGRDISVTSTGGSRFNLFGSTTGISQQDQSLGIALVDIQYTGQPQDPQGVWTWNQYYIRGNSFAEYGIPPNYYYVVSIYSPAYFCTNVINGVSVTYQDGYLTQNTTLPPLNCRNVLPKARLDALRLGALQVLLFEFENSSLQSNDLSTRTTVNSSVTYTANCTSNDGGVSGSGTSTTSTIDVENLTPGKTYSCSVTAKPTRGGTETSTVNTSNSVRLPLTPPQPSPEPIPTLSEWAQFIMMLMMIGTVGWYTRRMYR